MIMDNIAAQNFIGEALTLSGVRFDLVEHDYDPAGNRGKGDMLTCVRSAESGRWVDILTRVEGGELVALTPGLETPRHPSSAWLAMALAVYL